MVNHLEELVDEWLEWKGYFVRRNVRVGRCTHGGFEGELDIVAYHPIENHLIHIEPSSDAHTWEKREERFGKKFERGRKCIIPEIFPWVPHNKKFEQWAVIWGSDGKHQTVGGGKVVPIKKLIRLIAQDVRNVRKGSVIPEHFPLLRTMQFALLWGSVNTEKDQVNAEEVDP